MNDLNKAHGQLPDMNDLNKAHGQMMDSNPAPPTYEDMRSASRARLLENAAHEARERRLKDEAGAGALNFGRKLAAPPPIPVPTAAAALGKPAEAVNAVNNALGQARDEFDELGQNASSITGILMKKK